jgi:hypothetical protein
MGDYECRQKKSRGVTSLFSALSPPAQMGEKLVPPVLAPSLNLVQGSAKNISLVALSERLKNSRPTRRRPTLE